jgi:5-methylcytosine-specific restriction endonuclease McrA
MPSTSRRDRAWLLATAKAVAHDLKLHSKGTRLRVRIPRKTRATFTDGWSTSIGDLGKGQPRLQVWLDRFAGYRQRKLYAGFRSEERRQIVIITKRVARRLWPVRIVTTNDTRRGSFLVLRNRLTRSDFNEPVLEKYYQGTTFYGIYDPARATTAKLNTHFCTRATAFFEDVARALPGVAAEDANRDVYPQIENRKRVASHLSRERSKLLAANCKIRDSYECQVCRIRFEEVYGGLGSEFAEAHHLIPLSMLRENVRTRVEDLTTVCANCHRMLHRMDGRKDDIKKLRSIVRQHS